MKNDNNNNNDKVQQSLQASPPSNELPRPQSSASNKSEVPQMEWNLTPHTSDGLVTHT